MARPRDLIVKRRQREFLEAYAVTGSVVQALSRSSLDARRLARMLDEPGFLDTLAGLRQRAAA